MNHRFSSKYEVSNWTFYQLKHQIQNSIKQEEAACIKDQKTANMVHHIIGKLCAKYRTIPLTQADKTVIKNVFRQTLDWKTRWKLCGTNVVLQAPYFCSINMAVKPAYSKTRDIQHPERCDRPLVYNLCLCNLIF